MGRRHFNVVEDVWPRSERQVNHQDDEPGQNDHRGRPPPALKVGDGAGQRGKRQLPVATARSALAAAFPRAGADELSRAPGGGA